MAEKETVRELLLRISGEIDPSVQAAFRQYAETVEKAGKYVNMTQKQMDEQLVAFVESRRHLEGYTQVWEKYQGTISQVTEEGEKKTKSVKKQTEEEQKSTNVLQALAKVMGTNVQTLARYGAGIGLVITGLRQMQQAAHAMGDHLSSMFHAGLDAARAFAEHVVDAFEELVQKAIELNSAFQQALLALQAMAQSEQGAASLMRVIREEAMRTGQTMQELVEIAPRLVPFSGGEIDRFRELLQLTARIRALRPDLSASIAVRAMQQFLSGYEQTLYRTFGVPTALIKKFTEELGNTPEALDVILSKMRVGDELVEAQADSWKGLTNTLRDFGERTLRNLTGPTFDWFNEKLKTLVNWLKTNSEQIRALATKLGEDLGAGIQDAANRIIGPEGLSEDVLFKAADWGARLIASLVEGILWGINNVLIPAVVQITQIIAMYLKGSSPPRWGLLSTIDKWFGPVLRAYLSGFSAEDFTALADIGKIIKAGLQTAVAMGEIDRREMNERLIDARRLTVQLVEEFRTLGSVSSATWGALGNIIGMDTQLIQGYLDLLNRVKAAQAALAAAQEAYAAAMRKVKDIQEEIRLFELETAEIPERYKRGRRMELEYKLMVAQKEAELRQEAVKAAQAQLQQAKEMLSAYKQMLQALYDLAKDATDALEEADEDAVDMFDFGPIVGAGDQVEELTGKFKDLYDSIRESFKGAREQMEFLVDFMRGLLGKPAFTPEEILAGKGEVLPEGWVKGQRAREALQTIAENLYKVRDAIGSIGKKSEEVINWWSNAPDWLKNLLKTGALLIAVNWATGGLLTALTTTILGAGLTVVGGAVTLPILAAFAIFGGMLALGELLAKAARSAGIDVMGPGEFYWNIWLRLQGGSNIVDAIVQTIYEAQKRIEETFPLFAKFIQWASGILPAEGIFGKQGDLPPVTVDIEPDTSSATSLFQEALQSIFALISGQKDYATQAVDEGVTTPILDAFREVEKEAVGESIFPDMLDAILQLFQDLPVKLQQYLTRFVDVVRIYGENAAAWWRRSITMMRDDLYALINTLQRAENAIRSYQNTAAQNQMTPTTGGGGRARRQMGGIVNRLETALLHPGEVILNIAQQRNLVGALAGGGVAPQPGFGAGAMSIHVDQSEWTFNGTPNEEEVRRLVREGTYDGINDVLDEVMR